MIGELLAVLGVAVLCGAWVLIQQAVDRYDPEQPGVEGSRCGSCTGNCDQCHERT